MVSKNSLHPSFTVPLHLQCKFSIFAVGLLFWFFFLLDRAINTGSFSTGGGSTDPMTSSRDFAAFQTTWKQLWSGEATAKPTFSKVFTYVDQSVDTL